MALRDQAIRLRRTKWRTAQMLAEELFLMLLQDRDIDPGEITIDLGDGSEPIQVPARRGLDPFGQFQVPDFGLPQLGDNPFNLDLGDWINFPGDFPDFPYPPLDPPGDEPLGDLEPPPYKRTRSRSQVQRQTDVVPGEVIAKDDETGLYSVRCHPMGFETTEVPSQRGFEEPITIEPESVVVDGVRQLQIASDETIPTGTWVFVWRIRMVQIIVREEIEAGPGTQGNREPSTSTQVRILKTEHCMQVPVWLR